MSESQARAVVRPGPELEAALAALRARAPRIALTNGSFDLLHVGHVRALEDARDRADALVVGLNSDASVRRYKAAPRPIVPEEERAELLAALRAVDLVVVFEDDTAVGLLHAVRPALYAKGTDYRDRSFPERAVAEELGIEVAFTGDPKDHAASDLIARIRDHVAAGRL